MFSSLHSTGKFRQTQQHGYSLLEVLVAITLSAILLTGLVELFISSSRNSTATTQLSRIQETGRITLQFLNADIRRAGYFGGNVAHDDIGGTLGLAASAGDCVANTTNWARMINQPIFGLNDTNAGYACVTNGEYLSSDVLTLRSVSSWPVATGDMAANRPYLRATLIEGRIFKGTDENAASNEIIDSTALNYALSAHTYYIGPSGRSCRGASIPSLWRKSISDTGLPISQELLAGVERLQFKYQVGNQYVDADNVSDWSDVLAIEISMLVRSECPESFFTNNRTFAMGDLADYVPADGYRRQLFTGVATIRN